MKICTLVPFEFSTSSEINQSPRIFALQPSETLFAVWDRLMAPSLSTGSLSFATDLSKSYSEFVRLWDGSLRCNPST